ncbi:hypothetical protein RU97_GL001575 [Enterococcus canis]|uniref:Uncharacterized protein n=1 Tax=Enterococcus canis TaxID=214095 RepID=A0A1L8RGU0_9ENTE|nr:V-type ATPase subunit [Enterococcus canis]OJG18957.1 hypothetical protein RU97_GL001575 [Enterococcus canis]
MKDTAYNQINPLIRIKESALLTNDQYERLLKAELGGVEDILKNTVYGPYLTIDFADHIETILDQEQQKLFSWAYENAPESDVVAIYTMRYLFHNLKVLTKAEVTGQNLDHLVISDGHFSLADLKSAIRTGQSSILPEHVMASINEVLAYFEDAKIMQAIDIIYDRTFLTEQRRLAEKLGYSELLQEVIAFIDLTNITTMARGILQGQHATFLTTVLSSSGSIPKETFLAFAEHSLGEFTDFLMSTSYHELLPVKEKELDVAALDKVKDDYVTSFFQKAKVMAFGPLPLLAFLNAKEIEWKNLRLLMVGKRSGFSLEQLQERMRLSYVS